MRDPRGPAAFAALLLAAAGIAFAEGAFFVAALPFAAWLLCAALAKAPAISLVARREAKPSFVRPGDHGEVRLFVTNQGGRLDLLRLEDQVPEGCAILEGLARWEGSLEAGATTEFAYSLSLPRGVHSFPAIEAKAESLFTARASKARLDCPALVVASPRDLPLKSLALQAEAARSFSGRSRSRKAGSGTDFAGTREYRPGDPLRSLNWRAESHWDMAIVNVYEEERALDVGVILDARAASYGSVGEFEAAAAAASSIAQTLLAGGNRVAFLCYGSTVEWTAPGLGREHSLRLALAISRARIGDHAVFERFDNIPTRLFPPKSAIVLVSPLLTDDLGPLRSLARLGYTVSILRPLPAGARADKGTAPSAATLLARRIIALEGSVLEARLRNAGLTVADWREGEALSAVTGFGRGRGRPSTGRMA